MVPLFLNEPHDFVRLTAFAESVRCCNSIKGSTHFSSPPGKSTMIPGGKNIMVKNYDWEELDKHFLKEGANVEEFCKKYNRLIV